jgi:hypothetical protein
MSIHTLHLIETKLLAARGNLAAAETNASVGLEELFGDDTSGTSSGSSLVVLVVHGGILRLEVLNQRIHVLFFLFLFG